MILIHRAVKQQSLANRTLAVPYYHDAFFLHFHCSTRAPVSISKLNTFQKRLIGVATYIIMLITAKRLYLISMPRSLHGALYM